MAGAAPTVSAVAARPKAAALKEQEDLDDAMIGLLMSVNWARSGGLGKGSADVMPNS
jgi:hypothetical protein